MLADRLDRIVNQLSRELVRVLREARRSDLSSLLPQLRQELARAVVKQTRSPGRPAKAAPKATKSVKKAARKAAPKPAAPKKRGAGSATRLILALLKARREGFRTEEIQRRLKLDPTELQETLQKLLKTGRIARHGQARGTRYSLPNGDGPESGISGADLTDLPFAEAEAPAPEPAIEVTDALIDRVRLLLSESASAVSLNDIQKELGYSRNQVKGLLGHMVNDGYLLAHRAGPSTRYQLNSHGAKTAESPVRVVRKRHAEEGGETPAPEAAEAPAAPVEEAAPGDETNG